MVTVVGGGIAGLVASVALARRGVKVILLEQSHQLGGRAATQERDGFFFNLGPHALYCNGILARTLQEWRIPARGGIVQLSQGAYLVDGARRFAFPTTPARLFRTGALGLRDKFAAAKLIQRMPPASPGESLAAWLNRYARRPGVRRMVEAFFRLGTYCNDFERLDARAALEQFGLGMGGVMYLDGGWKTLVEALRSAAEQCGVEIRAGQRVERAEPGMILATSPAEVERLTGKRLRPELRAVQAASLDIALHSLPVNAAVFGLGLDRPFYFSRHSQFAAVAPAGKHLVHIAAYGTAAREELESFADVLMPGWRNLTAHARFLPSLTVAHAIPSPQGRPAVDAIDGVWLAGDWVGSTGMLADAAAASGLRAAELAWSRLAQAA